MLELYFKKRCALDRLKTNVLYKEIRKFVNYLHDSGYQLGTIQSYVQKVEHFGTWLNKCGIESSTINREIIQLFLYEHLPHCHCALPCSRQQKDVRAALNRLLLTLPLRNQKYKKTTKTPVEKEIQRFDLYMKNICGFSNSTIHYRVRNVTNFLTDIFGKRQIKYKKITPRLILKYVSTQAKQYKPGSTKVLSCSLRCYFRFLQFKGKCSNSLIASVPTIPSYKLATIPKTFTAKQISAILASFNQKTPSGQRDYAMSLCFLELGIRASDLTNLLLDDINWENSTLSIRISKTLNARILPLPARLGKAIASYLKTGRPKTDSRNVFIRHSVPKGKPITIFIVRAAMRYAYKRAGLDDLFAGTHVFRHTLATTMHQKGATLKEVADILGHKCIDSTTIYTKLNITALSKVALPWPEVTS